jgi:nitrogen-specific signal transduction histidine kinase/DNA-binding NarL/FixJ family response regulator
MLNLIKTYQPFKKKKIIPTTETPETPPVTKSRQIVSPTPTCKSTPPNTSNFLQEVVYTSYQNLQFFKNDIIPESNYSNYKASHYNPSISNPSNSNPSNSNPSNSNPSNSNPSNSNPSNFNPSNYNTSNYNASNYCRSNFSSKMVDIEVKKDDKTEIMTFIRCLFHDFRSPLNNISLGINILDEMLTKDQETQDIINNMKESSNFIIKALNGFLNIKNIVAGNTKEFIQINNINFNIVDCIKNTEKLLMHKIKSKNLHIEYELYGISSNDENVYGDSSNLQHIFLNLLSNAVKFSENNTKITIRLSLKSDFNKKEDVEKLRYTYVIIDENKHIEPEIKMSLFKKYNTSDTSTGTGLGLYICKKIIEFYNGKIEHEYNNSRCNPSNPRGNIFRVEFEVGKPTVSPTTPFLIGNGQDTTLREGVVGETVGFPTPTIYIVDDCNVSRKMLKTLIMLKVSDKRGRSLDLNIQEHTDSLQLNILEETDGLDLIKKLGNCCSNKYNSDKENLKKTNVIFIDNQMQNMDGVLTIKLLRAIGYKNYIIGITGHDDSLIINDFKKNGADFVFTKPFSKEKLDDLFCLFARTYFQKPSK